MDALRQRAQAAKRALTTKEGFKQAILVEQSNLTKDTGSKAGFAWSNAHLDPTPPAERTWGYISYGALWIAYGFSTGVWTLGSSMIAKGLTPGQAVVCVFVAHLMGAIVIVINSRGGAVYHIGYPVYQRISFGPWGSFMPVLLRTATGLIWIGVQLYQGGMFTAVMIRAAVGHPWSDIENTLPASAAITTKNLIGTIIFFLITLPLLTIKIHKMRYLWIFKVIVLPLAVIPFFAWTVSLSPSDGNNFSTVKNLSGSELAWMMLSVINSAMGKTSPSQQNAPDLSRYAKNRNAPGWPQLITLPIANTAVACLGIFSTAATSKAWNLKTAIWNPWSLCDEILTRYWSPGTRTAIFLVALCWTFSIVVSNAAVNILPFGADIAALCPRYLSINRGQFVGTCLGLVIQPWYILASATSFMAFLSGYSLFLAAVVGISATDYFWRKGNIHVPSLYTGSKSGAYYGSYGFSWRAQVAFWFAIWPTLPGFAGTFPGNKVSAAWTHLYYISWLFALVTSAAIYFTLVYFFPPASITEARKARFEQWADDQRALLDGEVSVEAVTAAKLGSEVDLEAKKQEGEGDVVPVAPYEGRV
ncbi:hypothetical protein JCM6882_007417 [Rhodosporidiobolus microsporus]